MKTLLHCVLILLILQSAQAAIDKLHTVRSDNLQARVRITIYPTNQKRLSGQPPDERAIYDHTTVALAIRCVLL